ncbi:hypothetical protein [Burkholderia ubonensis]|uniref:hypothetical protein n=1 Tax=Burkholderia ubonensis TaxID=101571 RepID=UPI0012F90843|nr:hypothetical protein [Burkholderia ubonensis]
MGKTSWIWKLLCWVVLACAALAFYSGMTAVSAVIGVFAILLFVVDFRVSMSEPVRESTLGRIAREEGGPTVRWIVYLALAIALLLAAQFVMLMASRAAPTEPTSALCFICRN